MKAMRMNVIGLMVAGFALPALVGGPALSPAFAQTGQPAPAAPALTVERFGDIRYADIETWNASGCSFAVFRGKDNIALFDTQDPKKTAVFKIDGKLLFVAAGPPQKGAYWSGSVRGTTVRLVKGKRDPKFRNDGGSEGGTGAVEWSGPGGSGTLAVRWEEGC